MSGLVCVSRRGFSLKFTIFIFQAQNQRHMGFAVWPNRVEGASNAGKEEKMIGAYRKLKEAMVYMEEGGEEKGSL